MTARPATVDTVVLDIDGTLLDSTYHHTVAWQRAFKHNGYDVPCARIHRQIGMGGDRLVAAAAGDDAEQRHGDEIRSAWEKAYDEMLDEPGLLPGSRELIEALRQRGLRVVLASSAIPRHAERAFRLLDADRSVDAATTAEDAEESKPDPELLEAAIDRVHGSSSILVGDSVWDVEAGRRAGMLTICVLSGGVPEQLLREAGAAWVFADPADLLAHLDHVIAPA
ncbi:HAD family hydrolase [Nocardioides sp.]|uniref:HAD family hydrolase n=1 Tax=Nocardioides sp. TaxID=35761 RepID=UPI002ED680AD